MTNPAKPPDGQAVALVAAADTHPKCGGATPLQQSTMPAPLRSWKPPSTTTPGPSNRWKPKTMDPKLPGGQAVDPVADAGLPPEWML
jgi:hypothetical protein